MWLAPVLWSCEEQEEKLTWIIDVVLSMIENLQRTSHIQETHVVMESDEHLDRLEVLGVTNCTHLADWRERIA